MRPLGVNGGLSCAPGYRKKKNGEFGSFERGARPILSCSVARMCHFVACMTDFCCTDVCLSSCLVRPGQDGGWGDRGGEFFLAHLLYPTVVGPGSRPRLRGGRLGAGMTSMNGRRFRYLGDRADTMVTKRGWVWEGAGVSGAGRWQSCHEGNTASLG